MFEITVCTTFPAIHAVPLGEGGMEEEHEHQWTCEVTVSTEALDRNGMAIDFLDLEQLLERAVEPLAGQDLRRMSPFSESSASTENIALFIHRQLSRSIRCTVAKLVRVRVRETERHSASYSE
jgi:6-pyruvoyltetrahydropterin/6-carboxytetrahydropterin synthase